MSLKKINTVMAAAFIVFILWFGTGFMLSPEATVVGFGLPSAPSGDGGGFLVVTTVLTHHGSLATAFGVHCPTATLMVANGLLIMRETREAREAREAREVAVAPVGSAVRPA
ncbi:small membrane hydrophobic protein [Streptomyces sp. Act143]|uniref:small membrane hydrophobic protein n=1 Tax=Streptomyces sp. Act143 TaxID=2200760 RepID=UPI000D67D5D0|nr:small membrane hydrophobic protein [Streptomyces sp. Act143]PWI17931.1 small membrane hydrophobic protein [Streptomyces sp. Act143]